MPLRHYEHYCYWLPYAILRRAPLALPYLPWHTTLLSPRHISFFITEERHYHTSYINLIRQQVGCAGTGHGLLPPHGLLILLLRRAVGIQLLKGRRLSHTGYANNSWRHCYYYIFATSRAITGYYIVVFHYCHYLYRHYRLVEPVIGLPFCHATRRFGLRHAPVVYRFVYITLWCSRTPAMP